MNNLEIITEFGTFVLIGGVATAHVILPFGMQEVIKKI